MKILCLLCLVILTQGLPIDNPPENLAVLWYSEENIENVYIVTTWDKVENSDDTDPILGYKVQLSKTPTYLKNETYSDGTSRVTLSYDIKKYVIIAEAEVPADKNTFTYHGLKREGFQYRVAVQAYTAKKTGPLDAVNFITAKKENNDDDDDDNDDK